MQRVFIGAGIVFAALTIWLGVESYQVTWQKRVDFDVLGILWLLQNLPKLAMWMITLVLAGFSFYCFRAALLERFGALGRLSGRGEDARLTELYLTEVQRQRTAAQDKSKTESDA